MENWEGPHPSGLLHPAHRPLLCARVHRGRLPRNRGLGDDFRHYSVRVWQHFLLLLLDQDLRAGQAAVCGVDRDH